MIYSKVFGVCMVLAYVFNFAKCTNSDFDVVSVRNITTFLEENPSIKLQPLTILSLVKESSTKFSIIYTLGNRINGDRLIASGGKGQTWSSIQDIKLTLAYPDSGYGNVITYVQVRVEQSSSVGQGYVTSGGIGQRRITIIIEAKQTLYFNYNAYFFGY